jgi:hypothetical protein
MTPFSAGGSVPLLLKGQNAMRPSVEEAADFPTGIYSMNGMTVCRGRALALLATASDVSNTTP